MQAELINAQEAASRERERRTDGLEAALRDSHARRAEADMVRGQLEEARTAGKAAAERAESLSRQVAVAEGKLRALEQQAEQREAQVAAAAAAAASSGSDGAPQQHVADLQRALREAQAQVVVVTGEMEAVRKRSDDVAALLAAAQAAQQELSAANQALRAERDAAVAADKNAAGRASARVQLLEQERQQLVVARDALKQVGGFEEAGGLNGCTASRQCKHQRAHTP